MFYPDKFTILRKDRCLSINEIADKSKIARRTIYNWINQTTKPNELLCRKLANTLNVDVSEFTDYDNSANTMLYSNSDLFSDFETDEKIADIVNNNNLLIKTIEKSNSEITRINLLLRALFVSIKAPMFILDNNFTYIKANETFKKYVNFTAYKKITGFKDVDFFTTKQCEFFKKINEKVKEKRKPQFAKNINIDFLTTNKINKNRVFENSSYPILNSSGRFLGMIVFLRDVTESANQKIQLIRFENSIKHAANMGVWHKNAITGEYSIINDKITEITGYTREDFNTDKNLCETIIHEDDRKEVLKAVMDADKCFPIKHDYRIITKRGEIKWLHEKRAYQHDVNGILEVGFIRDITESKRNNEVQDALQSLLRIHTDFLDYVVWLIAFKKSERKGSFEYIYINNAVEIIFEESKENFKKNPYLLEELLHPDDKKRIIKWWKTLETSKKEKEFNIYKIITKSGKIKKIKDTHLRSLKNKNRNCVMGILEDITNE
jgi:PAS domain S-box-containing protein